MTYENATVLTPPLIMTPGVCGGELRFVGTRFTVASMRRYVELIGPEACKEEWPHIPFWWVDWCVSDRPSTLGKGDA